jgi:hypothetical protein
VRLRKLSFKRASLLFSVPVLLVFVIAVWQMQTTTPPFTLRAKLFPLLVAVPMLVVALYQVATELRRRQGEVPDKAPERAIPVSIPVDDDEPAFDDNVAPTRAQLRQGLLWFATFFVAVWALGFLVAIPLFTFAYFVAAGGDRWYWGVVGAIASAAFLWGMFDQWLHIPLLRGQVFTALGIG